MLGVGIAFIVLAVNNLRWLSITQKLIYISTDAFAIYEILVNNAKANHGKSLSERAVKERLRRFVTIRSPTFPSRNLPLIKQIDKKVEAKYDAWEKKIFAEKFADRPYETKFDVIFDIAVKKLQHLHLITKSEEGILSLCCFQE